MNISSNVSSSQVLSQHAKISTNVEDATILSDKHLTTEDNSNAQLHVPPLCVDRNNSVELMEVDSVRKYVFINYFNVYFGHKQFVSM